MPTYENDEFIAFDIDDILADPETTELIAKSNTVTQKISRRGKASYLHMHELCNTN